MPRKWWNWQVIEAEALHLILQRLTAIEGKLRPSSLSPEDRQRLEKSISRLEALARKY